MILSPLSFFNSYNLEIGNTNNRRFEVIVARCCDSLSVTYRGTIAFAPLGTLITVFPLRLHYTLDKGIKNS